MRIYDIYDEESDLSIGTLLYYEKDNRYIIELQDYLDEWTAPLLFTRQVADNDYTILYELSYIWVKERVIPSGRQNINSILSHHKLKEYCEIDFLEISEGRCSQDSLCVKRIYDLPGYVKERLSRNIRECMITEDNQLLCFFVDGTTKKINLLKMTDVAHVEKIRNNGQVLNTAKVGNGGYGILFNDTLELSARSLYEVGKAVPISLDDFILFVKSNVLDTSDSCDLLECSRQNLSYLAKEKYIKSIKDNVRGNLYLKGEILLLDRK